MLTPQYITNSIVINLERLGKCEMTKGEKQEITELLLIDQYQWTENSVGWKVLQALIEFVRSEE